MSCRAVKPAKGSRRRFADRGRRTDRLISGWSPSRVLKKGPLLAKVRTEWRRGVVSPARDPFGAWRRGEDRGAGLSLPTFGKPQGQS